MTLSQSLTSLPLSKQLKELGVKQESYFYWEHLTEWVTASGVAPCDHWHIVDGAFRNGFLSAFSVAELGEMLKARYQPHESSYASSTVPIFVGDGYAWFQNGEIIVHATTEADARAKMLIHLIESGIVKV